MTIMLILLTIVTTKPYLIFMTMLSLTSTFILFITMRAVRNALILVACALHQRLHPLVWPEAPAGA